MSVRSAHCGDLNELTKFNKVCSLPYFSIAIKDHVDEMSTISPFIHKHDVYEFLIPLSTIQTIKYLSADYIGEVGYIYPVESGVSHGFDNPIDKRIISITVNKDHLEKVKETLGLRSHPFYSYFPLTKSFLKLIYRYCDLYQQCFSDLPHSTEIQVLANEIVTILVSAALQQKKSAIKPEKQFNSHINSAVNYMYEHYLDSDLSIAKVAELSGYSVAYFTKTFKKSLFDTPITHLNKLRISDSVVYLMHSDLSLLEIANLCGYKNLSTFTEAFKVIHHLPPSKYRKLYCS